MLTWFRNGNELELQCSFPVNMGLFCLRRVMNKSYDNFNSFNEEHSDEIRQKIIRKEMAARKKKTLTVVIVSSVIILGVALYFLSPKIIIPSIGRAVSYYKLTGHPEQVAVGDILYFGGYEVNSSWRVLAVEDNKILIINERCILETEYDSIYLKSTGRFYSLEEWLNQIYYEINFNSKEKELITDNGVGNVFLLCDDEAKEYFRNAADRQAGYYDGNTVRWFLRSTTPGQGPHYVDANGHIKTGWNSAGLRSGSTAGVRPAIWLDLG